jgi:hypothetical protein
MFFSKRLPFAAHVIFSLHFHTFVLLLFSLSLLIIAADAQLGESGLGLGFIEGFVSISNLLALAGYLYLATGRAYNSSGIIRLIQITVLAFAVGGIFELYRFSIFLITLYSTT